MRCTIVVCLHEVFCVMQLENIQLLNPVKAAIETVENPKEVLKDDTLHAVTSDPLEDQDNRESH